ncbi:MAG: cyclic nucleotide-binding domain-containing protein [Desulfobacteraceae bacterium]|nr:cyclic nucleotide-binding domain-containing protein [Desulfobacteraceae bacterium]
MKESRYLSANRDNIEKLMAIPPLRPFNTDQLSTILRQSKIRQYESGENIIEEGETDPWLYFLLSGKVELRKKGTPFGQMEGVGEVMGEMSLIDGTERSTTIRSMGDTTCLAMDTSASNSVVEDSEKKEYFLLLYRVFLKTMSSRLRTRTEEIAALRRENAQLRALIQKQ